MIISKKYIRSLSPLRAVIDDGQKIIVCIGANSVDGGTIERIGFTPSVEIGETVLPEIIGPVTGFNANGKSIPLKDKPMETCYRQAEWTWEEFRGKYERVEKSKIVDVPYKRYPRKHIPPPSIELSIASGPEGEKLIVSEDLIFVVENREMIVDRVNIFLEAFGVCEVRNDSLESIIRAPVKKLNWGILPQGKKPWGELKPLVSNVINKLKKGTQPVIEKRFSALNVYEPSFIAVGRAGFTGYLIFGYPEKNLYVLESTQTNNATYIIEKNWEILSRLTKAEILDNALHKARVIHRKSWFGEINRILGAS